MDQVKKWISQESKKVLTAWVIPGVPGKTSVTVNDLKRVIKDLAGIYGYSEGELIKKNRKMEFVYLRYLFCFYVRPRCVLTLAEIGSVFGNQDHTTIIHAIDTFQSKLDTDAKVPDKLIERGAVSKTRNEYLRIAKILNRCL